MKRLLLFGLISPLFLASCVGEDVKTIDIENRLAIQGELFSLAYNEDNPEFLRIRTNLDENEDIQVIWESKNPSLLSITEDQKLAPVLNSENIGEAVFLSGKAYRTSDITVEGEPTSTSKFIINEGAEPFAELDKDIKIFIARVSITTIQKRSLGFATEAEGLAAVVEGFPEIVEFTESLTSIDIDAENIPPLRVQFTNFKALEQDVPIIWTSSDTSILEIDENGNIAPIEKGSVTVTATVANDFTDKDEDISASINIEVSEETVVVIAPEPEPQATIVAMGSFLGLTGYSAAGGFEIAEEAETSTVQFTPNFDTGSVPDLVLYLSNSIQTNAGALLISDKVSNSGAQIFTLPEGANQLDYQYVLLYCRAFNVPVGFAKIER